MEPVHVVTEKKNVSELVLMPGDPLRAKYIAENFLTDARLINSVRNMLGYTGTYKGVPITVIASGMGIPSIGIYSYELAHFYGVKRIIRIGTAGSLDENVKVRDIVVANLAYSLSTFALDYSGDEKNYQEASPKLLDDIASCVKDESIHFGPVLTSDTFDPYTNRISKTLSMLGGITPLASEMETFGLYHIGKVTEIEVASMVTITNSKFTPEADLTSEEREKTLNEMITLALEAIIK